MTRFVVGADQVGDRLDVALAALLAISRSQAAARIGAGEVTVDGEVVNKQHRLRVGAQIEVRPPAAATSGVAPPLPPVRYQDDHLLVIAKPPGLVVHRGAGHDGDTLVDALQAAGFPLAAAAGAERPGIVHRLDRDTSGLMVIACTDLAYERLIAALAERAITRRYLALVVGVPTEPRGRIEAPIGRDPGSRTRFGVVAGGKPSVTRYRVLGTGGAPDEQGTSVALLGCQLETGRTHQIRVHLTALGHPIVGDPTYQPRRSIARALAASRPLLHAASLHLAHPVTGASLAFDEPAPDDLVQACAAAGIGDPDRLAADHQAG